MDNCESYFSYWGKSRKKECSQGDEYHLLPYHCLDVAAVGYQMVINNSWRIADYFASIGWNDRLKAANFFSWLLCWHDVGKFSHAFQQRYSHLQLPTYNERVIPYENAHHSDLGYWLWVNYFRDEYSLLPEGELAPINLSQILTRWMAISTAHHGKPPAILRACNHFRPQDRDAVGLFLTEVKALIDPPDIPASWGDDASKTQFASLSWLFSAVTVLADWAGSDTRFFPWQAQPEPLSDYWPRALEKAQRALSSQPVSGQVAPFAGIEALFPFIQQPTPLQQKMLGIDISAAGPQLFILEDVTGAGKTEAALILAQRLMAAGKAQGLFIGLPTMATANAMYERMAKTWTAFYQPDARPSLVLAHSARHLSDSFSQSVWLADTPLSPEADELHPYAQGCAAWFSDSNKKALLAEVGVGTLDQALMAVMPFKHHNLRLLGLHSKIVIADEIHACDAYMGMILEKLLETQARLGNSMILLSATLSQFQREKLVSAFSRGAMTHHDAPLLGENDYPWVTHVTREAVHSCHVETRPEVQRSVAVGWHHSEQECVDTVLRAVQQGECIAWIRNSVDDAIGTYRQLIDSHAVAEKDILLFHSRYAFGDRQRIENQTLAWFGKEGSPERAGKVLIVSPVLQESLDVDIDQMISDLAPVDLLIQRAGRLQRHIRDSHGQFKTAGQDERTAPVLKILAPEWSDEPPADWLSASMRNSAYVYPEHGQMWLTQRILREQKAIRMPQSARLLIESVYAEELELPAGLVKSAQEQEGKYHCDRAFADHQLVNFAAGYSCGSDDYLPDKLSTRLAEESITLWLAYYLQGEIRPYAQGDHAWEMSSLRVRLSWWNKHRQDFELLEGAALRCWCESQRKEDAIVIVLPVAGLSGYSPREGLTGWKE
jgi:CRISPR-associated endonuclease/helicase Cas3